MYEVLAEIFRTIGIFYCVGAVFFFALTLHSIFKYYSLEVDTYPFTFFCITIVLTVFWLPVLFMGIGSDEGGLDE
jgi:hypothetical protein